MNAGGRRGLGVVAIVGVTLVVLRLLGLFMVAAVATPSMSPHLPPGSVFLALSLEPDEGDVIVFVSPTGDRIVHRVVEVRPDGLVTQGDANAQRDQDLGWPLVDPGEVHVVPHIGGVPLALSTPFGTPSSIVLLQAIAVGALGAIALRHATRRWTGDAPRLRLQPHHVAFAAAGGLLLVAFLTPYHVPAGEPVDVRAPLVPATVTVVGAVDTSWTTLPLEQVSTGTVGPATVHIGPAYPGASALAALHPRLVFLPPVFLLSLVGLRAIFRGH